MYYKKLDIGIIFCTNLLLNNFNSLISLKGLEIFCNLIIKIKLLYYHYRYIQSSTFFI